MMVWLAGTYTCGSLKFGGRFFVALPGAEQIYYKRHKQRPYCNVFCSIEVSFIDKAEKSVMSILFASALLTRAVTFKVS